MPFAIQFTAEPFTPFVGGGSDLLPQDGDYEAECTGVEEGGVSGQGNQKLIFTYRTCDDDAAGYTIKKHMPVTGTDGRGKPNVRQLQEAMYSHFSGEAGVTTDEQAQAMVDQLMGQQLSSDQMQALFKGKRAWLRLKASTFERDDGTMAWAHGIEGYITKIAFVANGRKRRSIPAAAKAWLAGEADPSAQQGVIPGVAPQAVAPIGIPPAPVLPQTQMPMPVATPQVGAPIAAPVPQLPVAAPVAAVPLAAPVPAPGIMPQMAAPVTAPMAPAPGIVPMQQAPLPMPGANGAAAVVAQPVPVSAQPNMADALKIL